MKSGNTPRFENFRPLHPPPRSAPEIATGSQIKNAPNANMADHSVGARDELHESEASEASVFCFDDASPEKSCFVDGLVCFISLCLRVFELLNTTGRDLNLPQERKSFFSSLPVRL